MTKELDSEWSETTLTLKRIPRKNERERKKLRHQTKIKGKQQRRGKEKENNVRKGGTPET